jgi:hypothetical protein
MQNHGVEQVVEFEWLRHHSKCPDFVSPFTGIRGCAHHENAHSQATLLYRSGKPPTIQHRHAHIQEDERRGGAFDYA